MSHSDRRDNHGRRLRTSSQSSVEIQVTDNAIITTTTTTTATLTQNGRSPGGSSRDADIYGSLTLVRPQTEFLSLLKSIGAKGNLTQHGEIFTFKQLQYYFKEYIKSRQLYDTYNPRVVHCMDDPLGVVFGVKSFTLYDARMLLLKNVTVLDSPSFKRRPSEIIAAQSHNRQLYYAAQQKFLTQQASSPHKFSPVKLDNEPNLPGATVSASLKSHPTTPKKNAARIVEEPDSNEAYFSNGRQDENGNRDIDVVSVVEQPPSSDTLHSKQSEKMRTRKRKRTGSDKSSPSSAESRGDHQHRRRASSSISIMYSDQEGKDGSKPWLLTLEMRNPSTSESEHWSIQSKETAVVKSSTDDYWFLSSEDEISLEMEEDHFSVEIRSHGSDPPFPEEYDPQSDSSEAYMDETDSQTSEEEIIVVCHDSDMEFWADSESSDQDSGTSTDSELSESDKWTCKQCSKRNAAYQGNCRRCWQVRPDWLPDGSRKVRLSAGRRTMRATARAGRYISSSDNEDISWRFKRLTKKQLQSTTSSQETLLLESAGTLESNKDSSCDSKNGAILPKTSQTEKSESSKIESPCLNDESKDSGLKRENSQSIERFAVDIDPGIASDHEGPSLPKAKKVISTESESKPQSKNLNIQLCKSSLQQENVSDKTMTNTNIQRTFEKRLPWKQDKESELLKQSSPTIAPSGSFIQDEHLHNMSSIRSSDGDASSFLSPQEEEQRVSLMVRSDTVKCKVALPSESFTRVDSGYGDTVPTSDKQTGRLSSPDEEYDTDIIPPSPDHLKSSTSINTSHQSQSTKAHAKSFDEVDFPFGSLTYSDSGISMSRTGVSSQESLGTQIDGLISDPLDMLLSQSIQSLDSSHDYINKTTNVLARSTPIIDSTSTIFSAIKDNITETHKNPSGLSEISMEKKFAGKYDKEQSTSAVTVDDAQPSCSGGVKKTKKVKLPPATEPEVLPPTTGSHPQLSATSDFNAMCSICLSRPKDASLIHGKTGHQVCCYKCAKRLRRRGKQCPVCRRTIQKVVKNFFV